MSCEKMIQLKPFPDNQYACPQCLAKDPIIHKFNFESINVYADCTCTNCGMEFEQILPIGHTVDHIFSYGKDNKKFYKSTICPEWLTAAVLKSHSEIRKEHVSIQRIVYKEFDEVVILNTLDSLYGHVLLKLYNSFHHLEKDKNIGLIVIIPKIFAWLIPAGCAEAWVVDVKLSDLVYGHQSFQKFVADRLHQYKTVFISNAYSHPSIDSSAIEQLTGISPFKLENFSAQRPVITFILREDRWWFQSLPDFWFYRLCRKLGLLAWGSRILSERQNQLVRKTIEEIKKEISDSTFHLIGMGKTGTFEGVEDDREDSINAEVEKSWCGVYAKSHVVIGIHGSNMLLPTALAAGCVEILPEDRYGNIVQDITVRHSNRLQLFFYRFADQFSNPKAIAQKTISMIIDYELFNRNMRTNAYGATP